MFTYTFPQNYTLEVIGHLQSYNLVIENLVVTGENYNVSLDIAVPSEEYIHLHDAYNFTEV